MGLYGNEIIYTNYVADTKNLQLSLTNPYRDLTTIEVRIFTFKLVGNIPNSVIRVSH